jgi:hypothetical protein
MFVMPFTNLLFLALVLGALASAFITGEIGLLIFPFGVMAKAAALAFGLYLLLVGLGAALFPGWKYCGLTLAVTGTLIVAQLSIPETLFRKGGSSAARLYPGILTVAACWAFATVISWLGDGLANRFFGDQEFRKTLFAEAIGTVGGFMSLCFLVEYSRLAGA